MADETIMYFTPGWGWTDTPHDGTSVSIAYDVYMSLLEDVAADPANKRIGADSNGQPQIVTVVAPPPTASDLTTYAESKQMSVLAALEVSCALKNGSEMTLDTMCDQGSITFLNSLAAWALINSAANPAPTRGYYNLDGSTHQVSPAQMAEFLTAVGAMIQAVFDALATVRSGIAATPPTIVSFAEIDVAAWPASTA